MAKAKRIIVYDKETGQTQRYKSARQASLALGYNWQWAKTIINQNNGETKKYYIYYD